MNCKMCGKELKIVEQIGAYLTARGDDSFDLCKICEQQLLSWVSEYRRRIEENKKLLKKRRKKLCDACTGTGYILDGHDGTLCQEHSIDETQKS